MRCFLLLILFGVIFSFSYVTHDVYADSEFFVYNTKGSYNLGCELDNSCFEPYIMKIAVGDIVTWKNSDDAIHVVVSGEFTDSFLESRLVKGRRSQACRRGDGKHDFIVKSGFFRK